MAFDANNPKRPEFDIFSAILKRNIKPVESGISDQLRSLHRETLERNPFGLLLRVGAGPLNEAWKMNPKVGKDAVWESDGLLVGNPNKQDIVCGVMAYVLRPDAEGRSYAEKWNPEKVGLVSHYNLVVTQSVQKLYRSGQMSIGKGAFYHEQAYDRESGLRIPDRRRQHYFLPKTVELTALEEKGVELTDSRSFVRVSDRNDVEEWDHESIGDEKITEVDSDNLEEMDAKQGEKAEVTLSENDPSAQEDVVWRMRELVDVPLGFYRSRNVMANLIDPEMREQREKLQIEFTLDDMTVDQKSVESLQLAIEARTRMIERTETIEKARSIESPRNRTIIAAHESYLRSPYRDDYEFLRAMNGDYNAPQSPPQMYSHMKSLNANINDRLSKVLSPKIMEGLNQWDPERTLQYEHYRGVIAQEMGQERIDREMHQAEDINDSVGASMLMSAQYAQLKTRAELDDTESVIVHNYKLKLAGTERPDLEVLQHLAEKELSQHGQPRHEEMQDALIAAVAEAVDQESKGGQSLLRDALDWDPSEEFVFERLGTNPEFPKLIANWGIDIDLERSDLAQGSFLFDRQSELVSANL